MAHLVGGELTEAGQGEHDGIIGKTGARAVGAREPFEEQAILAHALPLLARGTPVSQVAAASGYASDSAFSAMFKAAMGQSPSHFQVGQDSARA